MDEKNAVPVEAESLQSMTVLREGNNRKKLASTNDGRRFLRKKWESN